MNNIKIAIAHDWLTGMRGGEKCLEVFCELYPDATLFTLFHKKGKVSPIIEAMDIRTSYLQKIPGITRNYCNFLPLFTRAIESFDLSGYDLVLSSSHCVAKGIKKKEGSLHICYCYTPVRYAWKFFHEYFSAENPLKRRVIAYYLERFKEWDLEANKKVDYFVAISDNIKNRIREYYSRDADIIYPPVDVLPAGQDEVRNKPGYYLIVSALVPYKRIDLAVEAFDQSGRRLIVIGSGVDLSKLKKRAADNVKFLGWVKSAEEVRDYYSGCRALIFPGEEDFGIVPVEAQYYGKPVIAYGRGGVLETIVPLGEEQHLDAGRSPTGVYFHEQTVDALNEAVSRFEKNEHVFDPDELKDNARQFNRERFKREIQGYVEEKWQSHIESQRTEVREQRAESDI